MATVNDLVQAGMWKNVADAVVGGPIDKVLTTGTALTLTAALHAGKTICFNNLAGTAVTLPAATGSGTKYHFLTTIVPTSSSNVVQTSSATQYMSGKLTVVDNADGTSTTFGTTGATTTASDTITLNRTTTGAVRIGEAFTLTDAAAGWWAVDGFVVGTGSEATPFSAAV